MSNVIAKFRQWLRPPKHPPVEPATHQAVQERELRRLLATRTTDQAQIERIVAAWHRSALPL